MNLIEYRTLKANATNEYRKAKYEWLNKNQMSDEIVKRKEKNIRH